jgi:hypothetical protein
MVAKNDYAINGGTIRTDDIALCNGISCARSTFTPANVVGGASYLYLAGEKYLDPDHYTTGEDPGDNDNAYSGDDQDLRRWGIAPPARDGTLTSDELANGPNIFGSPHVGVCYFAFGDGNVRAINLSIDLITHQRLCDRKDKYPIDPSKL